MVARRRSWFRWVADLAPGLAVLALFAVAPTPPASAAGDVEYGQYLSGECATCHYPGAEAHGIPPINGLGREAFVDMLHEYQTGLRANPVMREVARSLGDDEVRALAEYYSQLQGE